MSWTSALLSPPKLREVGSLSLLLLCSYLAWSQYRQRRELQLELAKQRREAERQTKLRDEERKGRIRAEKELRQSPAATSVTATTAEGVVQGSEATESFEFHPIGSFQSCYRQRCGTPRQSNLVKSSLAVLRCVKDLNPEAALEGLAEFSHVWVLYVFHENTNTLRQPKSLARRVQQQGRVPLWQGLCMKVAPPRCPELRVGVLACRTHRPNPVGLSLAKVVEVKASEGLVVLSGLDVIDGTPCLDLKPYLPSFESLPDSSVPQWVQSSYDEPMMEVSWSPMAAQQLALLLDLESLTLEPFASGDELKQAIEETLALDIRSPLQKQRHPNPGGDVSKPFFTGDLWFHQLHLKYSLLPLPSESAGSAACAAAVRLESLQFVHFLAEEK